ncbi:MAG: anthranilate phosphoribosyltransferase [Deltaproteobacteria bacterium]|nr:anthranilate phosphoribosyltransferase [Deltaproteobacteria bacterium]
MIEALRILTSGRDLNSEMAQGIMESLLDGRAQPEQIGALLATLHFRPPTGTALAGFVRALKKSAEDILLPDEISERAVDVCGTGGDGIGTFNISTAVAFVVAAAGQPVAKHGNRAVSSRCGSFDVLEALRVPFADNAAEANQSLKRHGLAFLYAPSFHPTLRKVAPVRQLLGMRTVFNALGPLLNPAGIRRQLIGVYSANLIEPVAQALAELGSHEVMVVHGEDGADEISLCAPTKVAHLKNGKVRVFQLTPEEFGFSRSMNSDLQGGDAQENARILIRIFEGETGPKRDIVLLNAGAALMVGGQVRTLRDGVDLAHATLQSGRVLQFLNQMRIVPNARAAL